MRLDADPPRLRCGNFRDRHFEHAVVVACLDLIRLHIFGQRKAALEGTRDALQALETLLILAALELASSAQRQYAVVRGDVDVLGLDAGQVRRHDELVGILMNVNRRDPAGVGLARGSRYREAIAEDLADLSM